MYSWSDRQKYWALRKNLMERSTPAEAGASDSRRAVQLPDDVRRRALARLYARRSAVNNLILALERYQQNQRRLGARCAVSSDEETSS
jgi:hypothetical protein